MVKISMQQVHGNRVCVVDSTTKEKTVLNCDGLVTSDKDVTLEARTADCLPISFRDKNGKVIALIHAGWRGLKEEIIKNAINILNEKFSILPTNTIVQVGPHICQRHYEVNNDVSRYFKNETRIVNGKQFLSLKDVALRQLLGLGILTENITFDDRCTFEDESLPSYRRNKTNKRILTQISTKITL